MNKVLVTGADGFIGRALCQQLLAMGYPVIKALRSAPSSGSLDGPQYAVVGEIDATTDWQAIIKEVDVVIHLAARVHITQSDTINSLAEFRKTNVEGTLNLARQAAIASVRRFIFISSIKVNGELTKLGHPFTADDTPAPVDAYGLSKLEAEQGLQGLARETGMQVVVIRPPIVYGPGVRANFLALMRCIYHRIPLPLGAIDNRRSILALDNLVDLIILCISHPAAANQLFLARDREDIDTTGLLRSLATMLNKKAWLLPIPVSFLKKIALLLGKQDMAQKLCGSLQVDMHKTQELLGWQPPVSTNEALLKTAAHFQDSHK